MGSSYGGPGRAGRHTKEILSHLTHVCSWKSLHGLASFRQSRKYKLAMGFVKNGWCHLKPCKRITSTSPYWPSAELCYSFLKSLFIPCLFQEASSSLTFKRIRLFHSESSWVPYVIHSHRAFPCIFIYWNVNPQQAGVELTHYPHPSPHGIINMHPLFPVFTSSVRITLDNNGASYAVSISQAPAQNECFIHTTLGSQLCDIIIISTLEMQEVKRGM